MQETRGTLETFRVPFPSCFSSAISNGRSCENLLSFYFFLLLLFLLRFISHETVVNILGKSLANSRRGIFKNEADAL